MDYTNRQLSTESPVSLGCFTVKKWVVSGCILVEIIEAVVFILLAAISYNQHKFSTVSSEVNRRRNIVLSVILWTLVILVRLLFLYGCLWERFWLCLSYAVISFGHIVIIATSDGDPNWISIIFTTLVTIVSLLYVMDLFLIYQDQAEKEQQLIVERRQQMEIENNNNKIIGTLV